MPDNSVSTTLIRVFSLLRLLPKFGAGAQASELHQALLDQGYDIDKRTVERDLKTLLDAFPAYIKCNDKSRPFGWRWHDGQELNVANIGLAEALSLRVIEETLTPLLPGSVLNAVLPRFEQARRTLNELAPDNPTASWSNKVCNVQPAMPSLAPVVSPDVLHVVQEALLEDEQIEVEYRSASSVEPRAMSLNPLAIVQRGQISYLIASAWEYEDPRRFAMHRIQSAARTYLPAHKGSHAFNLQAYLATGAMHFDDDEATGEEIRLNAWISDGLKLILSETPLSVDQQLVESDGSWTLQATVRDTRQLKWWILQQGAAIRIDAPEDLRSRIAAHLQAALAAYKPPQ